MAGDSKDQYRKLKQISQYQTTMTMEKKKKWNKTWTTSTNVAFSLVFYLFGWNLERKTQRKQHRNRKTFPFLDSRQIHK